MSPEDDPADLTRGWQRPASRTVDEFCHRAIRRELDAPSLAMGLAVGPSCRECLHHECSANSNGNGNNNSSNSSNGHRSGNGDGDGNSNHDCDCEL